MKFTAYAPLLICSLVVLVLLSCPSLPLLADALSDYEDCSKAVLSTDDSSAPLSKAERLKQLYAAFVRALSDTDRCEEPMHATSGNDAATISKNTSNGEESIAVDASLNAAAIDDAGSEAVAMTGREHYGKENEALEDVDNNAILREQLKAKADQETDPDLKKMLMEEYEARK